MRLAGSFRASTASCDQEDHEDQEDQEDLSLWSSWSHEDFETQHEGRRAGLIGFTGSDRRGRIGFRPAVFESSDMLDAAFSDNRRGRDLGRFQTVLYFIVTSCLLNFVKKESPVTALEMFLSVGFKGEIVSKELVGLLV